jgi:hypothetical protein
MGFTLGDMRRPPKRVFQSILELAQIVQCCLREILYQSLNVLQEKMFLEVQNMVFLLGLDALEVLK